MQISTKNANRFRATKILAIFGKFGGKARMKRLQHD
jgi:hypothetical protein